MGTPHSSTTDFTPAAAPAAAGPHRADVIRRALVTAILEHRLDPGTKLGEDEIGSLYGVSRTIVRGVLQSLAHEGLVVIEKNRGAFVAHPSVADAREVFEARRLIESATTALAAERRDPAAIARLRTHLAAEARAAADGDEPTAIRLSGEFHIELARIAGHRTYETFLAELVARSSLILLLYRRRSPGCGPEDHMRLVDAVEAGRAAEAVDLMDHHLAEILEGLDLVDRTAPPRPLAAILGV
jgi:DNA-binding GntR family transcriptional regulator